MASPNTVLRAARPCDFADIGHQRPELTPEEHEARADLMVERETHLSPPVFRDETFGLYFWRHCIDVW